MAVAGHVLSVARSYSRRKALRFSALLTWSRRAANACRRPNLRIAHRQPEKKTPTAAGVFRCAVTCN